MCNYCRNYGQTIVSFGASFEPSQRRERQREIGRGRGRERGTWVLEVLELCHTARGSHALQLINNVRLSQLSQHTQQPRNPLREIRPPTYPHSSCHCHSPSCSAHCHINKVNMKRAAARDQPLGSGRGWLGLALTAYAEFSCFVTYSQHIKQFAFYASQ